MSGEPVAKGPLVLRTRDVEEAVGIQWGNTDVRDEGVCGRQDELAGGEQLLRSPSRRGAAR